MDRDESVYAKQLLEFHYGWEKGERIAKRCEDIIERIVDYRESIRLCADNIGMCKSSVHQYIHTYIKRYYDESYQDIKRQLKRNRVHKCNMLFKKKRYSYSRPRSLERKYQRKSYYPGP